MKSDNRTFSNLSKNHLRNDSSPMSFGVIAGTVTGFNNYSHKNLIKSNKKVRPMSA